MQKDKVKYFKAAKEFNEKVFRAKKKARLARAKKPIEEKIKDLIEMQKIMVKLHPELKNIIPWRIGKNK